MVTSSPPAPDASLPRNPNCHRPHRRPCATLVQGRQDHRAGKPHAVPGQVRQLQILQVVDAELRLVAWNRRYAELFAYPARLLRVGVPVADL